MKLSHVRRHLAQARPTVVSQEASFTEIEMRVAGWLKNKMDSFAAWQTSNNNWFGELRTCAEEAEEFISKNYGYVQTVKTTSKFAQLRLGKTRNSAEVLGILKRTQSDARAYLQAADTLINKAIANPTTTDLASLKIESLPHYEDMILDGELVQTEVATISPRDFMTYFKYLGNLESDFKKMTNDFASKQPELRRAVQRLEDKSLKQALNSLIDFRMQSLDIYRWLMESISYYCRDSLSRVTTKPDEIPSKESYPMKNTIAEIRKRGLAAEAARLAEANKVPAVEDHDVSISVTQDNDQTEPDPVAGEGEEIDLDKLKGDSDELEKKKEIEQATADEAQANNIDDIAQAVDSLESALVTITQYQSMHYVSKASVEALTLQINTALEGRSHIVSVPTFESLILDQRYELNRLEREVRASLEGLVDDVKIWVAKQVDTVNSKFNWSKLYDQLSQEADKTLTRAENFKDAASPVEAYKVPIAGDSCAYLAHAEHTSDIPKVWNDYCTGVTKTLTGRLEGLERAMAANIATIMRSNKDNDEIAKDFFRNLSEVIHIDGSYIGYGWQNTVGNKIRKLFGRHMNWEPATFADERMSKVRAVWAMHPKDIPTAVGEFKALLDVVKNFELDAPKRREALRKSVVSTIEAAAKASEDKTKAKAIRNAKSIYTIVIETEHEIDRYLHHTMIQMSDYLWKSSQFKTIASSAE